MSGFISCVSSELFRVCHVQVPSDVCYHYFLSFMSSPLYYLSCLHIWVGLLTDLTSTGQGSLI